MKILSCIKPGLLEYSSSDIPKIKPGHSILEVKRIGICGTDLHAYEGTQPYFEYPRILGHELSATIKRNRQQHRVRCRRSGNYHPLF
jgi:threonine dehydrogenase-like Zn-dependent dehydrogenase